MTRLHLLLTVACVTGAAATVARTSPQRSSPTPPAAGVAPGTAKGVPVDGQAGQVGWLARYGTYNARQGSWSLLPVRQGSWSLLPNPNGC
jgi:hypothetical protein